MDRISLPVVPLSFYYTSILKKCYIIYNIYVYYISSYPNEISSLCNIGLRPKIPL